jgi:hypothetical protein
MSGTTTNAFSVGRDCQLVVIAPSGRVDLSHVTAFESRQVTAPVRVNRIDGVQLAAELPKGWDGSFELERGSSVAEDFIAALEAGFYAGAALALSTLYQYINETDGSTSTYQFQSVVFKLAHAGVWRGDASVKQRLEFFAATRTRL